MNPANHQHAVFGFDVSRHIGTELAAARVDLARLQRATKGAEQSTGGCGDDVVERGRVRFGERCRIHLVVFRDPAMDAEHDRLRFTRESGDAQRALDAIDVDVRGVDDVSHAAGCYARSAILDREVLAVSLRPLLAGGDRRSQAQSAGALARVLKDPALVPDLVALTNDEDWLVSMRALDLLEKLAHSDRQLIAPHKHVFIGPLAESDKWEVRLQIVRALPLFRWTPSQMKRVEAILVENVAFPQTFVRAWALDSLATFAKRRKRLAPIVERYLYEFENSSSAALRARARNIRRLRST